MSCRWLFFLFLFALAQPQLLAADPASCEKTLTVEEQTSQVQLEINQLLAERGGFDRMVLRLRKRAINGRALAICEESGGCTGQDVAKAASEAVIASVKGGRRVRGYAILVGTMVGSAALSSHLIFLLPKSAAFLTQLVGQIAALGIYVFGAPIWEPISSFFRKLAFGFGAEPVPQARISDNSSLENLWRETQSRYSLNAQMSRNVLNQFLAATQANFHAAFNAVNDQPTGEGRQYAIEQIAEAAVRMRKLFAEIPPNEESVAMAVRASFTNHVANPASLYDSVLGRIRELDKSVDGDGYYTALLTAWLK